MIMFTIALIMTYIGCGACLSAIGIHLPEIPKRHSKDIIEVDLIDHG